MPRAHASAPDQAERDAAVAEREKNVLIDAGAGTGKTTILVDRLVEMVAPRHGGPALSIDRIAAITFTRKAAGELRLRIRERLLAELAEPGLGDARGRQLRDALAGLDTALVGTIHSFADRLLRLRPVEAELSPSFEIAEDDEALVRETFEVLLQAVQSDRLAAELTGTTAAGHAHEATVFVVTALGAGLRSESRELDWSTLYGLDALVAGFVHERDVPPPDAEPAPFDAAAFHAAAEQAGRLVAPVAGRSHGARWVARLGVTLQRLRGVPDPVLILRDLERDIAARPRDVTLRHTFEGDSVAWKAWKRLVDGDRERPTPLLDDLRAPLHRWMATRLARLFPVVVALYEKVKARRRVLDQLDLLVKLRDLLRDDRAVRREFQQMFDHVFVDEFQDTDPLQAEIVLFLCEREPAAARWQDVRLRPGALTLVGDPKQSIYRFRRADVAMYHDVREVVRRSPHLTVTLSANFRSAPALIAWLNDCFDRVLEISPDGRPFDPASGRVFHQRLLAGRKAPANPGVHVLPFDFETGTKPGVDGYRKLEGRALARYLRWLVEASDVEIEDPLDGRRRRVRHGDVAVLAVSTWRLALLFPSLDAEGIPWASRGGTLFLADPLHRQLLLGLRALADPDDGVAEAALLRPPFFAVDLADLARERAAFVERREPDDEGGLRARAARDLVRDLRRHRLDRPPGVTARDLLERTAFARAVALAPNGAERLARLRELCLVLETTAAAEGLDYDAATARLRAWVNDPVQLDPPHPAGTEAVQILTVHQAKGLEFPVVVVWDGKGQWDARLQPAPWRMERDGRGWLLSLDGLAWEEPANLALRETEQRYLNAERRRVIYVAATRARDLLVIPRAGTVAPIKYVCGDLLDGVDPSLVRELPRFPDLSATSWERELPPPARPAPRDATAVEREVSQRWAAAAVEAARPRFRPASVSGEAHATAREERRALAEADDPAALKPRAGRFGHLFGSTVHHALGLALRDPALDIAEAVRRSAARFDLTEHLDDAAADVRRALDALRAENLLRPPGPDLQLEYPIAGVLDDGTLVSGYIDLVAVRGDDIVVLDFKTDAPPTGPIETAYPEYVAQARAYGRLLEAAGVATGHAVTCGLLFSGAGTIAWPRKTS